MAITLTNPAGATTLTLPDALNWVDEYAWSPVVQAKTYTTTGALLIEEATKQHARDGGQLARLGCHGRAGVDLDLARCRAPSGV
jgi:hypothetical protein